MLLSLYVLQPCNCAYLTNVPFQVTTSRYGSTQVNTPLSPPFQTSITNYNLYLPYYTNSLTASVVNSEDGTTWIACCFGPVTSQNSYEPFSTGLWARMYLGNNDHPQDPSQMTTRINSLTLNSANTQYTWPFGWGGVTDYCAEFTGYFSAGIPGFYTFGVDSDDNSDCFIDGILVADWYQSSGHGALKNGNPGGNTRQIYLVPGFQRIDCRFEQVSVDEIFYLYYKTPGSSTWQVVPGSALWHHPADQAGQHKTTYAGNERIQWPQGGASVNLSIDINALGKIKVYSSNDSIFYNINPIKTTDIQTIQVMLYDAEQGTSPTVIDVTSIFSPAFSVTSNTSTYTGTVDYRYYAVAFYITYSTFAWGTGSIDGVAGSTKPINPTSTSTSFILTHPTITAQSSRTIRITSSPDNWQYPYLIYRKPPNIININCTAVHNGSRYILPFIYYPTDSITMPLLRGMNVTLRYAIDEIAFQIVYTNSTDSITITAPGMPQISAAPTGTLKKLNVTTVCM